MLKAELYEASEKGNQLSEQKREMSKVINKLEDQLAALKKENFTLVTELLKKDDQMSKSQSETSDVVKQLENQLAKLKKENSTLATELSKVSEKDKQFTELCNQFEFGRRPQYHIDPVPKDETVKLQSAKDTLIPSTNMEKITRTQAKCQKWKTPSKASENLCDRRRMICRKPRML